MTVFELLSLASAALSLTTLSIARRARRAQASQSTPYRSLDVPSDVPANTPAKASFVDTRKPFCRICPKCASGEFYNVQRKFEPEARGFWGGLISPERMVVTCPRCSVTVHEFPRDAEGCLR